MNKRKIAIITGTRADFGKMKTLMSGIDKHDEFACHVFITGMHMLSFYGSTYREVVKEGYKNIYQFINQTQGDKMDVILANTIIGFGNYVKELKPDMIVIHGDRLEAFAGSIVGAFNNILVGHIEGGEVSGTIDESIRHSITKLAHVHFVANEEAKNRIIQLGENKNSVYIIGSPDIDVMLSDNLPEIESVKNHYGINYNEYSIMIYHPVTTELDKLERNIREVVSALIDSEKNYIVIMPNNDEGTDIITKEYQYLHNNKHFKLFPSIRFEYFLTFLKNAEFIIGNSSAGVREACVYALPTINIGIRQQKRCNHEGIINVPDSRDDILQAIKEIPSMHFNPISHFGKGDSAKEFLEIIETEEVWKISKQKLFFDIDNQ